MRRCVLPNRASENVARHDAFDDIPVGIEKAIFDEPVAAGPLDALENAILQSAGKRLDQEKRYFNVTIGIAMPHSEHFVSNVCLNGQLFRELALQRSSEVFVRFGFASRKFPLQPVWIFMMALAYEHMAVSHQKSCGNANGLVIGHIWRKVDGVARSAWGDSPRPGAVSIIMRAQYTAVASISTSISGSISRTTPTMVVAGWISPKNSACALATSCQRSISAR